MRVLVLGATGLIGNGVAKHFLKTKHEVILSHRNSNLFFDKKDRWIYFNALDNLKNLSDIVSGFDYVINCIGIIKPFIGRDPISDREINAVFPWKLASACKKVGARLIHITTDCVFTGKDGLYHEESIHDAPDVYGKSKSLGEPISDCMVIRASMVGEEIHNFVSLMSWARNNKGLKVKGFVNHFWNGITTKEYAIVCQKIMENDYYKEGLYHLHASDVVSKFDMLHYFNEKYNLNLIIEPFESESMIDRSLSTKKDLCQRFLLPSVSEMIMRFDL